ncbi:MAG: hypothetical protein OEZ58_04660 [Gammaproteobacteria bacterium]|nr:hypothetical protein [Gammaproteobacteria bacterium]MDH5728256.1 hypothetical protein [Gammaproteobacteria bacterium]
MSISNQDRLKLNVLLRQNVKAIRIDESNMQVHACMEKGESKFPLNPTCPDHKYLRLVRELLSAHVTGSPGGYPVFIKRWTRMEQSKSTNLGSLLLLGEPEAVIAVANSPALSIEVAELVWWSLQSVEVAQMMLNNATIRASALGRELAKFLFEFLPFESEPQVIIDSLKLIVKPGLLEENDLQNLWRRGQRKAIFCIGFLNQFEQPLPDTQSDHFLLNYVEAIDSSNNETMNAYLAQLQRICQAQGQQFLAVLKRSLEKYTSQEEIVEIIAIMDKYFHLKEILDEANLIYLIEKFSEQKNQPEFVSRFEAMLAALNELNKVEDALLIPVLSHTDAMGSVLRQKLEDVIGPIRSNIETLVNH